LLQNGEEFEFDHLFTIIFEKLEIDIILFFNFVNCVDEYIQIFFTQLYESVYLYKNDRKFDALYFLFPNTDFFIKNENYVVYIANENNNNNNNNNNNSNENKNDPIFNQIFNAQYTSTLFNTMHFNNFLNINYPLKPSNEKIIDFLSNINILKSFIKFSFCLNINHSNMLEFLSEYEQITNIHKLLLTHTNNIQVFCFLNCSKDINYNLNFNNFIKNLISNQHYNLNSKSSYSYQNIKILNLFENSEIEESNDENDNNKIISSRKFEDNFVPNNSLKNIDKFIHLIINFSLKNNINNKINKLKIEFYDVLKIEKINIKNIVENNLNIIKEKNILNNITNNFDDEGFENSKNKNIYHFNKEILTYSWFLNKNQINFIKINIIYCIEKKIKIENKKKLFKIIFDFLFINNKYFYCDNKFHKELSLNQNDFENNFFL